MLKIAKVYAKNGSEVTKKSGFFYSSGKVTRATIAHGIKWDFITTTFENFEDPHMYQLMQLFNAKAKQCKTSCVYIKENTLFYSYNCDCGIAVFDEKGVLKFQSVNNAKFGVFTGHRSYDQFINIGIMPIETKDTIVLYNGGFDSYIKAPEFWKNLNTVKFEQYLDSLANKLDCSKERGILVFSLD